MGRRLRDARLLVAIVLLFAGASTVMTQWDFSASGAVRPSSFSPGRSGLKAVYSLFAKLGYPVRRWDRPFTHLRPSVTFIVVAEPLVRYPDDNERRALWNWVDRGGSLLAVVSDEVMVRKLQGLDLDRVLVKSSASVSGYSASPARGEFGRDAQRLSVRGTTYLDVIDRTGLTVLAAKGDQVFAATYRYGRGRVVLVTDSLGFKNDRMLSGDTAVFAANIAGVLSTGRRAVAFDEYHHGYGVTEDTGKSVWAALGSGLRWSILYAAALFMLLVIAVNHRFGAPLSLPQAEPRSSVEYLHSMAGLYRRACAPEIAVEWIRAALVRDLSSKGMLDRMPDAQHGVAECASMGRADNSRFQGVLRRLDEIAAGDRTTHQELLCVAQQVQEYRKANDLV